jgi:hypothetical protein
MKRITVHLLFALVLGFASTWFTPEVFGWKLSLYTFLVMMYGMEMGRAIDTYCRARRIKRLARKRAQAEKPDDDWPSFVGS